MPDPTQVYTQRCWNGVAWTPQAAPLVRAVQGNGAAAAAIVFGIPGFFLTPIPLLIGRSVVGLVLGGLMFLLIFTGAGTIW